MKPRTIQLFVTPTAGLLAQRRADALRRALAADGTTVILTKGGFEPLAIDGRADHVCAVGGDGTLRYVVDAVRRLDRPVGVSVYPAGTVNLTAMEYGYPKSPHVFARRVLDGTPTARYLALVDDLPLVACASVGPDSHAVAAVTPGLKRCFGRFAYVIAFLSVLIRWPRTTILLRHDGRQTECEAVYIAKGPFFAGPWSIAPDARGADPYMHVVALPCASRAYYLRFVWAIYRRRVPDLAGAVHFTCRTLTIDGTASEPVQADGDVLAHLPVTIDMETSTICFA